MGSSLGGSLATGFIRESPGPFTSWSWIMADSFIISFIINGLLGVAMFFMKLSSDTVKDDIKTIKTDLKEIRDTFYKKEDFKDFKEELWLRLDRMEADFTKQITELKNR